MGNQAPNFSPQIQSYVLDGEVLILDERQGRLYRLNSTASFIWEGLAAGLSTERIVAEIGLQTGTPRRQVAADIDGLIAEWRAAGFFDAGGVSVSGDVSGDVSGGVSVSAGISGGVAQNLVTAPCMPAAADRMDRPRGFPACNRAFALFRSGIRVAADETAASAVDTVLGHLPPAPESARDWPLLEIFRADGRWLMLFEGGLLDTCTESQALVPMLHGNMTLLLYHASSCFAALHASAVALGETCILMPGASGSGKSTLAAALTARGYRCCTDDLALLTGDTVRLLPVPLRPGLKSGSWPVLAASYPGLAALPAYRRADGKLVKYLPPPDLSEEAGAGLPVAAMIFPKYVPGSSAVLRPLPRCEALVRVAEAGYDLPERLDRHAVVKLLEWIGDLRCCELLFDSLDEAVERVSRHLL